MSISIFNNVKLKINCLFTIFVALEVISGNLFSLGVSLLALLFHELGHILVARIRKVKLDKITLLPYGAELQYRDTVYGIDDMLISTGGPIVSGLVAIIAFLIYSSSHLVFFKAFCVANTTLFVFNIIPAYPLDGSKILLALFNNKLKAIHTMKKVGVALGSVFFILFLLSMFYKINYSCLISSIFLIIGAKRGEETELLNRITYILYKRRRNSN